MTDLLHAAQGGATLDEQLAGPDGGDFCQSKQGTVDLVPQGFIHRTCVAQRRASPRPGKVAHLVTIFLL